MTQILQRQQSFNPCFCIYLSLASAIIFAFLSWNDNTVVLALLVFGADTEGLLLELLGVEVVGADSGV